MNDPHDTASPDWARMAEQIEEEEDDHRDLVPIVFVLVTALSVIIGSGGLIVYHYWGM